VRIDMESSAYTESRSKCSRRCGTWSIATSACVLQSCLYRTERDLRRMNELARGVRLV
jgi:hypothetical protein